MRSEHVKFRKIILIVISNINSICFQIIKVLICLIWVQQSKLYKIKL